MRGFTPFARFTKGVITDRRNVPGALLEAQDLVPLRGGEAWTKRDGLTAWRMSTVDTVAQAAIPLIFNLFPADQVQVQDGNTKLGVTLIDMGTAVYRLSAIGQNYNGSLLLTERAVDHAGVALPHKTQTNNISGAFTMGQAAMQYAQEVWQTSMWVRGALRVPSRWAGNVAGVERATGTVSGALNGTVLTIAGDTFSAADEGMYVYINAGTVKERAWRIVQFLTSTTVLVDAPFGAAFSGVGCRLTKAAWWGVKPGTFGGGHQGYWSSVTEFSHLNARAVCTHQGVAIAANVVDNDAVYYPHRLRNSYADADFDGQWSGCERWHPNAYIDVEPGVGGKDGILAVISSGGDLLVFKQRMVWAIRGSLSPDGTDLGVRVDRVLETDGLANGRPVETPEGVVFIGKRGIYRIGQGTITNLTERAGVTRMFRQIEPNTVGWADGRLWACNNDTRAANQGKARPSAMIFDAAFSLWYSMQTFRMPAPIETPEGSFSVIGSGENGAGSLVWMPSRDTDTSNGGDDNDGVAAPIPTLPRLVTHVMPLRGKANGRLRAVQVRGSFQGKNPASAFPFFARAYVGEEGAEQTAVSAVGSQDSIFDAERADRWQRLMIRGGCPVTSHVRVHLYQTEAMTKFRVDELGVEHVSVARTR